MPTAGPHLVESFSVEAPEVGISLTTEALRQPLLPAKQVQGLQNAGAAAKLLETSVQRISSTGSSGPGAQLLALLSASTTGAVDTLPDSTFLLGGSSTSSSSLLATSNMAGNNDLQSANKLAAAMQELGYSCTADSRTFNSLLKHFPAPNEGTVAEVLCLLARTHTGFEPDHSLGLAATLSLALDSLPPPGSTAAPNTWNIPVVIDGLKAAAPGLSWPRVAEYLDQDGFYIPDAPALRLLMAAFRRASREPFPLSAILNRIWRNSTGQLSFLTQAVAAPPDVFSFDSSPRKSPPVDGLPSSRGSTWGGPNQAWASIDLLATLCQLADAGLSVKPLLEAPMKSCPEVLLLTTAAVRPPHDATWGLLERGIWGHLCAAYLAGQAQSGPVLKALWERSPAGLIAAMSEWHAQEPARVTRLLEVCQELNILAPVLDGASPGLAVDLACLAARREYLHLDKWLGERLARDVASGGGSFMAGAIAFLEAWLTTQLEAGQPMGRLGLVPEALAAFLRGMAAVGAGREPGLAVGLGRLYQLGTRAFQGYEGMLAEAASAGGSGMPQAAFPQDVEDEANSYFQKIYSESMPVEEVVGMLKAFKNSSNPRQQEVFACMVHNLFDEYRFFPNYPDKELDITAALFGALLHHQLVTSITLGMALRFVLQALTSLPGTKMFRFGMGALSQFRNDLHLWPQFCARAAALPHLSAADEGLVAYMENIARADTSSGSNGGAGNGGPSSAAVAAAGALPSATDADLAGLSKHREASSSGVDISGISGMFTNQQLPPVNSSFSGLTNGPGIGAAAAAAVGGPDAGGSSTSASSNAATGSTKQESSGASSQQQTPREQKGGGRQSGVPNGTAGGGAGGGKGKAESMDKRQSMGAQSQDGMGTGEGLKELGGGSVSAAAADLVLREKPERMTLNMTANNETLEMAERKRVEGVKAPGDSATDKVSFIMNNLTVNNVNTKAKELAALVLPQFMEWFANYLVVKRAAQVGCGGMLGWRCCRLRLEVTGQGLVSCQVDGLVVVWGREHGLFRLSGR